MNKAAHIGLVFNSNKCKIRQSEISFQSVIFTAKVMKPDHIKVQVLQDIPTPDN